MKNLKLAITIIFVGIFGLTVASRYIVRSQSGVETTNRAAAEARRERLTPRGEIQDETPPLSITDTQPGTPSSTPTEAPTGFDNRTNGFSPQGPAFDTLNEDNVVAGRSFNDNRFIFEEVETNADGVGPTYNAQSCRECHQNVVTGGASQVTEHRTGRMTDGAFFESLGGSLIQSRATNPNIVERVNFEDDIRTFRISTNTLGNGFIEAVSNNTILAIRDNQPAELRGTAVNAPVLEANSTARIGRFGWKNQHASLESFAGDAYLNEMGITNPLFLDENTSSGRFVGFGTQFDPVPEPEDDGDDLEAFADFMRSTKAPSRGPINNNVNAGQNLFIQVGCAVCHLPVLITAPTGTVINGGDLTVPAALGNKLFHPYTDLLLHDVGTGDGIPIQPTPEFAATANQIRTAPLWALRTRNRLMHDGLSFTLQEAILRHAGQATPVTNRYNQLTDAQKNQVLAFLNSL